jgi:hypothetical protein
MKFLSALQYHTASLLFFGMLLTTHASPTVQWQALPGGSTTPPNQIPVQVVARNQANVIISPTNVDNIRRFDLTMNVPGYFLVNHDGSYQTIEFPGVTGLYSYSGKPVIPMKIVMLEIPYGATPTIAPQTPTETSVNNINIQGSPNITDPSVFYPEQSPILSWDILTYRNRQILRLVFSMARVYPAIDQVKFLTSLSVRITLTAGTTKPAYGSCHAFDRQWASYTPVNQNVGRAAEKYMIICNDQFMGNTDLADFILWKRWKGYNVVTVKTSDIKAGGQPTYTDIRNYLSNLSFTQFPAYLLIIGSDYSVNGVNSWKLDEDGCGTDNATDAYYGSREVFGQFPAADCFYGRLPAQDNSELSIMLQKAMRMDRYPPSAGNPMYNSVTIGSFYVADQYSAGGTQWKEEDRRYCETADGIACYFEGNSYNCTRAMVGQNSASYDGTFQWNNNYSILWKPSTAITDRVANTLCPSSGISNLCSGVQFYCQSASDQISSAINNGSSIVFFRSHGGINGWQNSFYSIGNIQNLENFDDLSLVWSVACYTGNFTMIDRHPDDPYCYAPPPCYVGPSYPVMAHQFLIQQKLDNNNVLRNVGAYAVVASTNLSPTVPDDWMSHGLTCGLLSDYVTWQNQATTPVAFGKQLPTPGCLVAGSATKIASNVHFAHMYTMQNFLDKDSLSQLRQFVHVFGDPEGDIVLHEPQVQSITHPTIIPTGSVSIQVLTGTGSDGVQVCLFSQTLGIQQVAISQNGTTNFTVNSSSSGVIHVTATGFGKRPYQGLIIVGSSWSQRLENAYPATQGKAPTYLTLKELKEDSKIYCQILNTSWPSQTWIMEAVAGSNDRVRLKCNWNSGTSYYLTATGISGGGNGDPVLGKALHTDWSSQIWLIESGRNGTKRLKNTWSNSTFLTSRTPDDMSDIVTQPSHTDWASQEWNFR